MKRFEFSLETAKRFRAAQLRMEEARHAMLLSNEAHLEQRMSELRFSHEDQRFSVSRGLEVDGAQLGRLHEYGEFVALEINRIQRERDSVHAEIENQSKRVAVARQRVELLEKLKEKEWGRWKAESAKELQAAAEESFAAKWIRER